MYRLLTFLIILIGAMQGASYGQEWVSSFGNEPARGPADASAFANWPPLVDLLDDELTVFDREGFASDLFALGEQREFGSLGYYIVRGQSPDSEDDPLDHPNGTGTGMAEHHPAIVHKNNTQSHPHSGGVDPTDPTAILTQLQFQNTFTWESYNASGYANTFVVQPVLPFPVAMPGLKEFFPFHLVRPTLPFPAPTADPDGPLGVQGGMSDLTILDVYLHPTSWGNYALGYSLIAPTATHPQLGRQEWQLGPTAALVYKKIPKTNLGAVVQTAFSLESDAQEVDVLLVAVRHLPNQWYVRWGDTFNTFDTATGAYNIPIQPAVGKVVKKGLFGVPNNIFLAGEYTPEGLHSGTGGSKWGIKLNVTLLFPEKKLDPIFGRLFDRHCNCRRHCHHR
jgi:hypothetical protein